MKTAQWLISVFIAIPIFAYLSYEVLTLVHATELMWFLFWIYIPAIIVTSTIAAAVDKK